MKTRNAMGLLMTAMMLASCAHHQDVRPGAKGLHRVVIKTSDKEEGARSAIEQANHFCKEKNKSAVFINENEKYSGDMDEKNYQMGKRASKVAKVIGGTTWVFGGKNESNLGGIVGMGGMAADAALGDGYTITMTFQCQ